MTTAQGILVVGGYGVVGRRIARDLAPDYPDAVVIAGRHVDRAGLLALELGHGARARAVDVTQPRSVEEAFDGIATVVSCIDQPEPFLLHNAVERGLGYTDITPHLMTRRPTDAMRETARRSGARIVLGAGLAPGVSSVLARVAVDQLGGVVERITSNVLALDPPWLGRVLSILVRTGITSLLARRSGGGPSQRLIRWLQKRYAGHDWYGPVVEAEGPHGAVRASLAGRGQADITALGAAAIARGLIDGQVAQPGIWLAEQIVPPAQFLEHLAANGVVPRLESVGHHTAEPGVQDPRWRQSSEHVAAKR
jgi:saccharopine dehydrogenase-like NADP-dependent oxidoreductase